MSSGTNEETPERVGAFSFPNYRRFFVGQALSNIGTWFQIIAQALLILKITGRASSLGEAVGLQGLPMLLFGPFVGPILDRANLRRVLIGVALFAGAEAATLSALTATHHITIWWIFGMSFALGFAQIFNQPSVQAIVSELVPVGGIPSAVSLNGVMNSVGRLAGPALAALLYSWRGAATCYAVNASSYAVVTVALLLLRPNQLYPRRRRPRLKREMRESFRYAWRSPLHRGQLIANAFVGLFAWNFGIFFASFTQLVLHSGSLSLGLAESINAVAAATGGVVLSRRLRQPTRRTYLLACTGLGTALGLTALSPNLVTFYICMLLFGTGVVTYTVVNQTLLQLNTPSDRIGSVMALSTYGTMGTTPIGALIIGWLTTVGTARAAIGAGSASLFISVLVLQTASAMRRNRALVEPPRVKNVV
jgi:MFS family permease